MKLNCTSSIISLLSLILYFSPSFGFFLVNNNPTFVLTWTSKQKKPLIPRYTRLERVICSQQLVPFDEFGIGYYGSSRFPSDTNIIFAPNALEIGVIDLEAFGFRRPLVLHGWNAARADALFYELEPRSFEIETHSIDLEPKFEDILSAAQLANDHQADCIIAMGGGSVLDAGKLVAFIAYSKESPYTFLNNLIASRTKALEAMRPQNMMEEDIGTSPIPLVTIPTVAGTGSETNPISILYTEESIIPGSKRVHLGVPRQFAQLPPPFLCLAQPGLSRFLPTDKTWYGAFAALCGLIDGFLAAKGFMTDMLCIQNLQRIVPVFEACPGDLNYKEFQPHRETFLMSSVINGMTRMQTGPSLCHIGACVLGTLYGVPYSIGVTLLAPAVLAVTLDQLVDSDEEEALLAEIRATRLAEYLNGAEGTDKQYTVEWLLSQIRQKRVPSLDTFKINAHDAAEFVEEWKAALGDLQGSTSCLAALSDENLENVFLEALNYKSEPPFPVDDNEDPDLDPGNYAGEV
mmetsp:Transcript_16124/g.21320  ORF Transcript_16124/g.21320 Transcript_16124/m.21320 type:complete len:518 (+) Transcript_16124:338-1891(+)